MVAKWILKWFLTSCGYFEGFFVLICIRDHILMAWYRWERIFGLRPTGPWGLLYFSAYPMVLLAATLWRARPLLLLGILPLHIFGTFGGLPVSCLQTLHDVEGHSQGFAPSVQNINACQGPYACHAPHDPRLTNNREEVSSVPMFLLNKMNESSLEIKSYATTRHLVTSEDPVSSNLTVQFRLSFPPQTRTSPKEE